MRPLENDLGRREVNIPVEFMVDYAPPRPISNKIWLREMIRILSSRLLGMHVEQLELAVWASRYPATPMPKRFHKLIQIILSQHSAQSVVFHQRKGRAADDLFYSPAGKGSGTWAVHKAKAEAWLKRHQDPRCMD